MLVTRMDEGVKDMTDETRKRLPGIVERIDELRDEVDKIAKAEVDEYLNRGKEIDRVAQLISAHKAEQLYGVYGWLDSAARALENF